jgi:transposase
MTTNHARAQRPDTETETTEVQPRRSGWTAAEKLAILNEYESYPHGDLRRGALLRRVGAYTSHISKWRKQRARGSLAHLAPLSPGRKPQPRDPLKDEVAQLQREVARLQARLQQAEAVIEIQKKVALLLGEGRPASSNNDA